MDGFLQSEHFQPRLEPLPLAQLQPVGPSLNPHASERYWLQYRKRLIRATRLAYARACEPALLSFTATHEPHRATDEIQAGNVDFLRGIEWELRTLENLVAYPERLARGIPDGDLLVDRFHEACSQLLVQRTRVVAALRFLILGEIPEPFYAAATNSQAEPELVTLRGEPGQSFLLGGRLVGIGARDGEPFIDFSTRSGVVRIPASRAIADAVFTTGAGGKVVLHYSPENHELFSITRIRPGTEPPEDRQIDGWCDRIHALQALRSGWDTYGAPPIDSRAIGALAQFVGHLLVRFALDSSDLAAMNIGPTHDGGVSIEWDVHTRTLLLTIEADGSVRVAHGDDEDERTVQQPQDLVDDVTWLRQLNS